MQEKASRKIQADEPANTFGVGDQSTQPSSIEHNAEKDLPLEFGRYRLLKQLGEGGMGAVYLAHDTELDRKVALKIPHFKGKRSKDLSERFRREARLAATLDHPNICRVFDIGEHQGRLFLTMALVEGKSLHEIIKAKGAIEPRIAVALLKRIANAVQFAHDRGIIHRDLKPANIMIKKDRDFVIMDFGLARRLEQEEEQLTAAGAVLGTPAYMAPELLRGENEAVGPQSDVYSLGIIFYELLTGQRPFQGTLPQIYAQVLTADSVTPSLIRSSIDPAIDGICQKATQADASQRFKTVDEFASALSKYLVPLATVPLTDNQIAVSQDDMQLAPRIRSSFPSRRPSASMLVFGGVFALFFALLGFVVIKFFNKDETIDTMGVSKNAGTFPQKDVIAAASLSIKEGVINSSEVAHPETKSENREMWQDNSAFIKFVWIPAGKFKMGEDSDQVWVTLTRGFWLGQTEITQGQWKHVMVTEPWEGNSNVVEGPSYAASHINWKDAVEFCRKLTESEQGQGRLPKTWRYRLPSEAQWEYACRAGTTTKYSFGDEENQLSDYAWWGGRYGDGNAKQEPHAHEVAKKLPNQFGLYDVHGNVWEWCQDWKGDYGSGAVSDPTGPTTGTHRVFRGGCWHDLAENCRTSYRYNWFPGLRADYLGFRVALTSEW